jgi:hypothetical protein
MINNFDDLCLWIYVIIDDEWKGIQHYFKRLHIKALAFPI